MKNDRETRSFQLVSIMVEEGVEPDYTVRGHASTFEPYELWNDGEYSYMEQMDRNAFDAADMSDVIFLFNHEGMVYARLKNGTLSLSIDDEGLLSEADLSSTTQSRELYEAIRSGLVDQMSFAFTVAEDDIDVDRKNKVVTRTIKQIRKVYDVSAVSIPANPGTDISAVSARAAFHGAMEELEAERLQRQKDLAEAKAKYFSQEVE